MRITLPFIFLITLCISCKNEYRNNDIIKETIDTVFSEIIKDACVKNGSSNTDSNFIAVSNNLEKFDLTGRLISSDTFNVDNFLQTSQKVEYDLLKLPQPDNININFIDKKELPNFEGKPFEQSIHIKFEALYGSKYCKSIIFSSPRILVDSKGDLILLIKAIRYYEHPIEEFYYLAKVKNNIISYERLAIEKDKVIFH